MTAATLYMGWLRSTTIPCASSLTYLKSKNMSIFYHTSSDLEHGTDRPCTQQWLITTTQFRALYLEQLNGFFIIKPTWCANFTIIPSDSPHNTLILESCLPYTIFTSVLFSCSSWITSWFCQCLCEVDLWMTKWKGSGRKWS